MHPVAFQFGSIVVHSYMLAILVAIACGVALAWWRAPGLGLERRHVQNGGLLLAVSGIFGARILFALTHSDRFDSAGDWLRILDPRAAARGDGVGMAVLGGILLAIFACWVYGRVLDVRFSSYADLAAPSIALGQAIGRLGCFLGGCCSGRVCDLPWAVRFPPGTFAYSMFADAAVHPTQLYDTAFGFLHCAVLLLLARRGLPTGALFALYLVFAGSFRMILDTFRVYQDSELIGTVGAISLTAYQAVAAGMAIAGLVLLAASLRASTTTRSATPRSHRQ